MKFPLYYIRKWIKIHFKILRRLCPSGTTPAELRDSVRYYALVIILTQLPSIENIVNPLGDKLSEDARKEIHEN